MSRNEYDFWSVLGYLVALIFLILDVAPVWLVVVNFYGFLAILLILRLGSLE